MLANTGTPTQSRRVISVTREMPRSLASDRARARVTPSGSARKLELKRKLCGLTLSLLGRRWRTVSFTFSLTFALCLTQLWKLGGNHSTRGYETLLQGF